MTQTLASQYLPWNVIDLNNEAVLTCRTNKTHYSFFWFISFKNRALSIVVAMVTAKMLRLHAFELLLQSVGNFTRTNIYKLIPTEQFSLCLRQRQSCLQLRYCPDQCHLLLLSLHHLLLQVHQSTGQIHNPASHQFFVTQRYEAFGDIARGPRTCECGSNPIHHQPYSLSLVSRAVQRIRRDIA